MLAGVDEAGRGPVLGPLVVAAILIQDDTPLRELGVKDSKQLSPAKRQTLAPQIRQACHATALRVIHATELNTRMPHENLNTIEIDAFAQLLRQLLPTTAILDACDVNADRFRQRVHAQLQHPCHLIAEHEADAHHPVVAAASILAKVERDRIITELATQHGDIGTGYSHDTRTTTWLTNYVTQHRALPPIARSHWETSRRLLNPNRTLTEYP